MHIFISAYVLLALASWSALAAPLRSEHGNENAQKRSLSSSILMGRQQINGFELGLGPGGPFNPPTTHDNSDPPSHSPTMDCDSKPKSSKGDDKTGNHQPFQDDTTGPDPPIPRRRFSPMRRGSNDAPSIFERDDEPTNVPSGSGNPITVDDVLAYYLKQRAAARKRSPSPRTSRNFN